jgi:MFS family permease
VGIWTSALLACYAGAWLLASPVAGWLTNHFNSRRTTFIMALLALGFATILLYIGSSIEILVVGRVLQGISSAFTWTAGITLAVESVKEEEVGKTLGICSLGMNLALLVAPIIGGLLLDQGGYHSVFALTFGLLALDVVWRLALIERDAAAPWLEHRKHKYWTTSFGNNGTPKIIPSPVRADSDIELLWLESDEQMVYSKVECLVKENKRSSTFGPGSVLRLLQRRRLQVALWATFAATTLTASLDAVLPIFVRDTFSWGPQGAGLIFIPVVLPTFLSPYVGALTDKYGAKWIVGSAFLLGCPAWVLMRLVTHAGVGQVVLLCALLTLVGVTTALTGSPLMAEITFSVQRQSHDQPGGSTSRGAVAQANALYSLSLAGGLLAGPLWGGVITKLAGWKTLTWTFGLLSGLTVVPTVYFTGGRVSLGQCT